MNEQLHLHQTSNWTPTATESNSEFSESELQLWDSDKVQSPTPIRTPTELDSELFLCFRCPNDSEWP